MDWFQIGNEVCQNYILSPCSFNLYAEYIIQNAVVDEAQAGIKIARININNLRYADDTTLMAESEEEPKSLLLKVKEESEKAGLKLNIQKTKIMASGPITSWQIDGETMETVTDFTFLGSKISVDGDCSHEIKRCLLLRIKAMTNLDSMFKSMRHHFAKKDLYSCYTQVAKSPVTTREPISYAKAREFLLPSSSWGSHRYRRSSYREEP